MISSDISSGYNHPKKKETVGSKSPYKLVSIVSYPKHERECGVFSITGRIINGRTYGVCTTCGTALDSFVKSSSKNNYLN